MKTNMCVSLLCMAVALCIYALRYRSVSLPGFVAYVLPDGLWMVSLQTVLVQIWQNRKAVLWYGVSLCSLACLLEAGQWYGFVPGAFDWLDITAYILGSVIPLSLYSRNTNPYTV